jgi:hypothetical protein
VRGGPSGGTVPAVHFVEERELEAVACLGVVAVGLRLEEVVPRHAVVIGV